MPIKLFRHHNKLLTHYDKVYAMSWHDTKNVLRIVQPPEICSCFLCDIVEATTWIDTIVSRVKLLYATGYKHRVIAF